MCTTLNTICHCNTWTNISFFLQSDSLKWKTITRPCTVHGLGTVAVYAVVIIEDIFQTLCRNLSRDSLCAVQMISSWPCIIVSVYCAIGLRDGFVTLIRLEGAAAALACKWKLSFLSREDWTVQRATLTKLNPTHGSPSTPHPPLHPYQTPQSNTVSQYVQEKQVLVFSVLSSSSTSLISVFKVLGIKHNNARFYF